MEHLGGDQHADHEGIELQARLILPEQDETGRICQDAGDENGQTVAKSHQPSNVWLSQWNPHLRPPIVSWCVPELRSFSAATEPCSENCDVPGVRSSPPRGGRSLVRGRLCVPPITVSQDV